MPISPVTSEVGFENLYQLLDPLKGACALREHKDIQSFSKFYEAGSYLATDLGELRNKASSATVRAGYRLTVYDGPYLNGTGLRLNGDGRVNGGHVGMPRITFDVLGPGQPSHWSFRQLNDRVQSFRLEAGAHVYSGKNNEGDAWFLAVGRHDLGAFKNDSLRSVVVGRNCCLRLWEHAGLSGRFVDLWPGQSELIRTPNPVKLPKLGILDRSDTDWEFPTTVGADFDRMASSAEVMPAVELQYQKTSRRCYTAGRYTRSQVVHPTLALVSVMVPLGLRLTLFEEDNQTGRSVIFENGTSAVSDPFRRGQSMRVEPVVTLFHDFAHHGKSIGLVPGQYRLADLGWANNDVLSSAHVPQGMGVTLYEHDNLTGASKTYMNEIMCFDAAIDNRATSVVVFQV